MLRYVLTIAGAVAMISNVALAEMGDGASTKVITKSAEPGMASQKVVSHRHADGCGPSKNVVIHRHDDGCGAAQKGGLQGHDDRYAATATRKHNSRHHNVSGRPL